MNKNYPLTLIAVSFLSFTSCTKNNDQPGPVTPVVKTTLEILVKDGNSFVNGKDDTLDNVAGATIKLYANKDDIINHASPAFVLLTNSFGKAILDLDPSSSPATVYYFTVESGNKKNIINNWLVKSVYTYPTPLFVGEIKTPSYPTQTPALTLGSPIFLDANNDGVIQSPGDDVYSDFIEVSVNQTASKKSIIF